MKKNYCDITILIDRSGSMGHLTNDVIGGINKFIEDQKKVEGEVTLTLIQFDDKYEVNYIAKPIQYVEPLNIFTYKPRGTTAMLDAIAKAIISTGERYNIMPEEDRPEKVIFLIQTDGEENSSYEYNTETVKQLIEVQENKYSWEVVFMGANIDAVKVAAGIGIKSSKAMTFSASSVGVQNAFSSFSDNVVNYRTSAKRDMSYENIDYEKQNDFLSIS
jgi:uncharacterized protein YegL